MLDFYGLKQDGITIKDIRTAKPRRTWVYVAAWALLSVIGATAALIDLFFHVF